MLNKVDVPDGKVIADMVLPELEARGLRVFKTSAKTGEGMKQLVWAMAHLVEERRKEHPAPSAERIVIRPRPVDKKPAFTIKKMGDGEGGFVWRVRGEKPELWVNQTDFANDEAVGYLADRLNRLGVEDELLKIGAEPHDAVAIGAGAHPVVFDFIPQREIGAEILSRRGEDQRLNELRPATQRRRARDAEYQAARSELMGDDRDADWRRIHAAELDKLRAGEGDDGEGVEVNWVGHDPNEDLESYTEGDDD